MTLFIRAEKEGRTPGTEFAYPGEELFRRFRETHLQKGYTLEEIKSILQSAGMEYLAAYDGDTKGVPHMQSERIYVTAREHGKKVQN